MNNNKCCNLECRVLALLNLDTTKIDKKLVLINNLMLYNIIAYHLLKIGLKKND